MTVEFDALFPRNDTYNLAPIFPIIFAVQNMVAAGPSTALYLNWILGKFGTAENVDSAAAIIRLNRASNNSSDNPYYVKLWTKSLGKAAGV